MVIFHSYVSLPEGRYWIIQVLKLYPSSPCRSWSDVTSLAGPWETSDQQPPGGAVCGPGRAPVISRENQYFFPYIIHFERMNIYHEQFWCWTHMKKPGFSDVKPGFWSVFWPAFHPKISSEVSFAPQLSLKAEAGLWTSSGSAGHRANSELNTWVVHLSIYSWLVVWNIFYFSIHWE